MNIKPPALQLLYSWEKAKQELTVTKLLGSSVITSNVINKVELKSKYSAGKMDLMK